MKDVIVGKIYFLLVRIKIKHMELSIIRRETTGSPPNQYNESETITKFEIMDGAPVRGKWSFSGAEMQCLNKFVVQAKLYLSDYSSEVSSSRPHSVMSTRNLVHGITSTWYSLTKKIGDTLSNRSVVFF